MKTFIAVAAVAVLAVVFVEISEITAQGENDRRCPANRRPPLNTTEVECDRRASLGARLACCRQCRRCYRPQQLQRTPGCIIERKCTCLARPESGSSTTEGTATTGGEGEITTPPAGEVTTPGNGGEITTPAEGGDVTTDAPVV